MHPRLRRAYLVAVIDESPHGCLSLETLLRRVEEDLITVTQDLAVLKREKVVEKNVANDWRITDYWRDFTKIQGWDGDCDPASSAFLAARAALAIDNEKLAKQIVLRHKQRQQKVEAR